VTAASSRGDLRLPQLGLGGGPLGNLFHAVADDPARETVDAAWESGIRFFDTAPHYGLGLAERRLGEALRGRPRDGYVLSTKVGRVLVPNPSGTATRDGDLFDVPATHTRVWDFSRDGVRRSVEDSLRRLGLDRIDVLLLHDPDEHWRQAIDEGYPALAELRDAGVVRGIGVGMSDARMLANFVRDADLDLVMVAARYTLLDQGAADELLPLCLDRGVPAVAVALFGYGLLATDRPAPVPGGLPRPPEIEQRARRIGEICDRHGVALTAAAMRYPLRHPAVVSVVVGCHTAEQVRHNAALFAQPIPEDLWAELQADGLIQ
jgi:D-threo-aldose 1-dehydrogenase